MIAEFLSEHPDFRVVPVEHSEFFSPGETDWMAGEGNVKDDLLKRLPVLLDYGRIRSEAKGISWPCFSGTASWINVKLNGNKLHYSPAPWPTSRLLFPPERSIPESVKEKRLSGGAPGKPGKYGKDATRHQASRRSVKDSQSGPVSINLFQAFIREQMDLKLTGYPVTYGTMCMYHPAGRASKRSK